jgi:hypothetical protein
LKLVLTTIKAFGNLLFKNDAGQTNTTQGDAMKFLVDTVITNNTTGRSILKAFQVEAIDELDATVKALDLKSGNESIIVKKAHAISDFSHPL